jgi:hypothetical protein
LKSNTTYYIRIQSTSQTGSSAWSNPITLLTQ